MTTQNNDAVDLSTIPLQITNLINEWKPSELTTIDSGGYRVTIEPIINETVISFIEQATIEGINGGQPIDCKIDTGADMCSLHATNINVSGNDVSFSFNARHYRMALSGEQNVKQAGTAPIARPIISVTITLKDQVMQNIECNLSDRTDMTPLLIGKNALTTKEFTIATQEGTPHA